MSSYPVVWRNGGDLPLPGRLELRANGFCLEGGNGTTAERLVIRYDDVLGLERDSQARIGRCRAITVFSRNTPDLLIASVGGVGLLTEIFAALQQTLGA